MSPRLIALFVAGILISPALQGGEPEKKPTPSRVQLYAYANPLAEPLGFADHTWVTDYATKPGCPRPASAYWYSTGGCHPSGKDDPPRALGSAPGDLGLARCIAQPDTSTFQPGPATAQILYGVDGVCHQICNRVLAATATQSAKQATVAEAKGYRISRFVYGTHGTTQQWKGLRDRCGAVHALSQEPEEELGDMIEEARYMKLRVAGMNALRTEGVSLQARVREMGGQVKGGTISGRVFADRVNAEINASLRRLAESLGKEDFEQFFAWPAGQEIILVNPNIASEVRYR